MKHYNFLMRITIVENYIQTGSNTVTRRSFRQRPPGVSRVLRRNTVMPFAKILYEEGVVSRAIHVQRHAVRSSDRFGAVTAV